MRVQTQTWIAITALLFCTATLHAEIPADISKLVQEEKYDAALARVDALLKDKPDDKELQDLRAQIQAAIKPAAKPQGPAKLDGKARLAKDTLLAIADDAGKATSPEERKKLYGEFLDTSADFVKAHPDQSQIWLMRAVAAVDLERVREGWEAGQKLVELGALDSEEPAIRRVMADLNRRKWLDEKMGDKIREQAAYLDKIKGRDFSNGTGMELVWLTPGYWVGKYEVTQAEYEKIMGGNPSQFRGERRPVEQVSWNNAMDFCKALTDKEREAGKLPDGFSYTLPSEKQWEYFVGDADLRDAVYNRSQDQGTASVGSKGSNKFGLYDVRGNVWEWCADWYDSSQAGRVLRGASWFNIDPEYLAVSFRSGDSPDCRVFYCGGFRCVLVGGASSSSR